MRDGQDDQLILPGRNSTEFMSDFATYVLVSIINSVILLLYMDTCADKLEITN